MKENEDPYQDGASAGQDSRADGQAPRTSFARSGSGMRMPTIFKRSDSQEKHGGAAAGAAAGGKPPLIS